MEKEKNVDSNEKKCEKEKKRSEILDEISWQDINEFSRQGIVEELDCWRKNYALQ